MERSVNGTANTIAMTEISLTSVKTAPRLTEHVEDQKLDTAQSPSSAITRPENFEDILYAIKPSGTWQYMVLLGSTCSLFFVSILGIAQGIFLIGNMDHKCYSYADGSMAADYLSPGNTSKAVVVVSAERIACESPRGSPCTTWNYSSPYYTHTMLSDWNLVCSQSYKRSVYQSVLLLGYLIGLPIFGATADFFGRRTVILTSGPLMIMGFLGTALAPAFWVAACMRTLHGALAGGDWKAKFVLTMEVTVPKRRNFMSTMLSGSYPLAGIAAAVLAYFLRDWRQLQLYGLIPALCSLPFILMLPESPRWLITQRKLEQAHATLTTAARLNGTELPAKLDLNWLHDRHGRENTTLLTLRVRLQSLFGTSAIRRRTMVLFVQWFIIAHVFYGMTFYGTGVMPVDPYWTLGITSIVRILFLPLQIWTLDKYGGRNTLIAWLSLTAITLGVLGLSPVYGTSTMQQVFSMSLVIAGTVFIDCCFMCIYIITGELYPTISRQLGLSVCSMMARIGAGVSPFIANMLGDVWKPLPAIIFCVLCLISAVFAFLLPSASSGVLPDTVQDTLSTLAATEPHAEDKTYRQPTAADGSMEFIGVVGDPPVKRV